MRSEDACCRAIAALPHARNLRHGQPHTGLQLLRTRGGDRLECFWLVARDAGFLRPGCRFAQNEAFVVFGRSVAVMRSSGREPTYVVNSEGSSS